MIWLVRILSFFFLLVTLLPLLSSGKWYIRWWDFPRLQIAVLLLLLTIVWIVSIVWLRDERSLSEPIAWVIMLSLAFFWQSSHIVPFSWVYSKEVPDSISPDGKAIKFMVANIDYENAETADKVLHELKNADADVLLLVETNEKWMSLLQPLRSSYSHHFEHVQGEGLGLSLWSKFPILSKEKRRLVSERRVSLWTEIEYLPGHRFHFIGVHPTPPGLLDSTGDTRRDSRVRDAELVMIAKEIAEKKNQSWVVAGDFNDVAWSHTTRLFKRISGLSDPRIGRSFMGTYIAQIPPCRCPIDHVFLSDGFSVHSLSRMRISGSDHFAVIADVAFEMPHAGVEPAPAGNDHVEADKIIEEGKNDAEERGIAE